MPKSVPRTYVSHIVVTLLVSVVTAIALSVSAGSTLSQAQTQPCGITQGPVAFCETFDQPANTGTRSGQLNGTIWGVSRTTGDTAIGSRNNAWSPTTIQTCTGPEAVTPPNDVVICNGQLREATDDATNVTTLAMYPKQPFDFAGRTGIVTFDVSNNSQGSHGAWPEFWVTDLPTPAPFTHEATWLAIPRNGFGIRFAGYVDGSGAGASCPEGSPAFVGVDSAITISNYVENDSFNGGNLAVRGSDCVRASTSPTQLNHYEIHVSQAQIDIYGTDAGTTAPLKHLSTIQNANLNFTRGLIWLEDVHYNGNKFGTQRTNTFAWDNVGFDGPFTYRDLAFDALDNTQSNADGSVNLGQFSDANQAAQWNVLQMPANPSAAAVRVLFNFFPNTAPTVLDVTVNGHAHSQPWPYADRVGFSWRTLAVTIPITDLVEGTNSVSIGGDQPMTTSNIDIVLVDVTGGASATPMPTETSTPTHTPTVASTSVPTSTPVVTLPTPICYALTIRAGVLEQHSQPDSFCGGAP